MLLVLAPALTVLESLVKLHLAASELFKHRKGGYWLQDVKRFFFLSTVRLRKHKFGPPGEAKQPLCTVTANAAECCFKGHIQSSQPGSAQSHLCSWGQSLLCCSPNAFVTTHPSLVPLHTSVQGCSPHTAQHCVLLYHPEGFAGKAGHEQAGLLQAARQSQRCTSKHPGSPRCPLLLLSCSLSAMPMIKKPLCISREAGRREGHKDSRSCVFANNPAEL